MFKVSRGLRPETVNELFQFRGQVPYELSKGFSFKFLGFIQFLVFQKALNFLGQRYQHWCLMK